MPRPKSYDRDEAVSKACEAFWAHGYQALGVREIEHLTGLNQFAIRSEFGGKEGLYLEALRFYCDSAISTALAPLNDGGLDAIVVFLEGLVTEGSMTSSPWGCLIVNTGIENARVKSQKLEKAVANYWTALERHLARALANAEARGEIAAGTDRHRIAMGLVAAVMGIHARNRTMRSHDGGRDLVPLLCSQLQSMRLA